MGSSRLEKRRDQDGGHSHGREWGRGLASLCFLLSCRGPHCLDPSGKPWAKVL